MAEGFSIPGLTAAVRPADRAVLQTANNALPNELPSAGDVISAAYRGFLSWDEAFNALRRHGITTGGEVTGWGNYWHPVINSMQPAIPREMLGILWARRDITDASYAQHLSLGGMPDMVAKQLYTQRIGLPSPEWITQSYRLGYIKADLWKYLLSLHGISDRNYFNLTTARSAPLGTTAAIQAWRSGQLTNQQAIRQLEAQGYLDPAHRTLLFNLQDWSRLPSLAELLRLLRLGVITDRQYRDYVEMAGYKQSAVPSLVESETATFATGETLELLRRGLITADRARQHLLASGVVNQGDLSAVLESRFKIPTSQEATRWLGKIIPQLATGDPWGILAAMPEQVARVAAMTGTDRGVVELAGPDGTVYRLSPAAMEWVDRWRLPEVSQLLAVIRHITPLRAEQLRRNGINVDAVTRDQLTATLNSLGYSDRTAAYLFAANTPNIDVRTLRNARRQQVLDHAGIAEHIKRLGYLPEEAEIIASTWERQDLNTLNAPIAAAERRAISRFIASVQEGYTTGYLTKQQGVQQLLSIGMLQGSAENLLDTAAVELQHQQIAEAVKSVKRHFLHGDLSAAQAATQLARIGIVQPRLDQYISSWQLMLTPGRQHVSTQKILTWLEHGIITQVDAVRRLANLGWTNPDIAAFMREARNAEAKIAATAAVKSQGAKRQQLAEMVKLQREQSQRQKQLQSHAKALASVSRLQKWFKDGIISDSEFLDSLAVQGYPANIAQDYLLEAMLAANKKLTVKSGPKKSSAAALAAPSANGDSA